MADLRSERWFGPRDVGGLLHRACLKSEGISQEALGHRPVVGICDPWSEVVSCNLHFRALAQSVKRGILQAGGLPLEFPTISLGEYLMKPTAMLYRNLMAMDVEESIRSYPFDAVVLLAGCDKTIPAELMGAASADVPAIMVTAGPAEAAVFQGRQLGAGTDLWRYTDDLRAGRITEQEYGELEAAMIPSTGHCNEMGTASTMSVLVEGLGMSLPGSAAIPAVDGRRHAVAEASGRRAVALAWEGLRPSNILTSPAFDNAITLLMALGGSTNAVVHLLALAGRAGVDLRLERFNEIAKRTPVSGDWDGQDQRRGKDRSAPPRRPCSRAPDVRHGTRPPGRTPSTDHRALRCGLSGSCRRPRFGLQRRRRRRSSGSAGWSTATQVILKYAEWLREVGTATSDTHQLECVGARPIDAGGIAQCPEQRARRGGGREDHPNPILLWQEVLHARYHIGPGGACRRPSPQTRTSNRPPTPVVVRGRMRLRFRPERRSLHAAEDTLGDSASLPVLYREARHRRN